ncbi:hypothetical protein B4135_2847 [Caldibacillus debilis]|uniref:Uncharacterized protein n=1 Tax=Caldibacillus debilis TaxID=301148 RepID=A0A150LQ95_9BACI|nr:hypothetical protein B4135_2847 [Caldibacillus debilis]
MRLRTREEQDRRAGAPNRCGDLHSGERKIFLKKLIKNT